MTSKILVAGGSGFLGSHFVQELWKREKRVASLSRNPDKARHALRGIEIDYVRGDITEPESLKKALKGVETLILCVQFPNHPIENPRKGYTYEKVDGQGTRNLIAAAKKSGSIKQVVYISGAGVRAGRPKLVNEPWFRGKLMAEHSIIESGIPYTIFRPSWIYGREDRSLNKFVKFAQTLPFVPVIGDGKNKVQPLFIRDLAKIVADATDTPKALNQIYEAGGPQTLSMDEIVKTLLRVMGSSKPIVHHPVWFMKAAAAPLSLLPNAPLSPKAVEFITMEELVDNSKLLSDFNIKLTPLEEALETYIKRARSPE